MIVWLASYPRSGNTYLRYVISRVFGYLPWSVYPEPEIRGILPIPKLWRGVEIDDLTFVKTHREQDAKTDHLAIYLVRRRADALASHARYAATYGRDKGRPLSEIQDRLENGRLPSKVDGEGCWDWDRHTEAWLNRNALTYTISFDDLTAYPRVTVIRAMSRLGLNLPVQSNSLMSIEKLATHDERFFSARSRKAAQAERGIG